MFQGQGPVHFFVYIYKNTVHKKVQNTIVTYTVAAKKTPVLFAHSLYPKSVFFNELNFQKVSYIYAYTYTFGLKQIASVVFA